VSETDYIVKVHQEDDASYWAEVSELPGCFASGQTLDELSEALGESIALYLSDDEHPIDPSAAVPELRVGELRITVAA
jgi:predicted RNase H-like HicB family nuclease